MLNEMPKLDSPKKCKINFNGKEIALTQVLTYKIEENKKPVYGFNNRQYSTVIRGKSICTGLIIVKKTVKDIIDSMLSDKVNKLDTNDLEGQKRETKIKFIYECLKNSNSKEDNLSDWYDEMTQKNTQYVKDMKSFNKDNKNDSFLNIDSSHNITIEIDFDRDDIKSGNKILVADVVFLSKEGEINVSKGSIDEVYSFIGNTGV